MREREVRIECIERVEMKKREMIRMWESEVKEAA